MCRRVPSHPSCSTSGVFETPPRVVPGGARFREVIELGHTSLSSSQVDEVLKRMSREYLGDRYHLLYRNVRHATAVRARRGRLACLSRVPASSVPHSDASASRRPTHASFSVTTSQATSPRSSRAEDHLDG